MSEERQQDRSLTRVPMKPIAETPCQRDLLAEPMALDVEESGSGAPSRQRPFSPWQLLEYKWSIFAIFVLMALIAVGGIWTLMIPQYKATAMIEVSPIIPQLLAGKSDMVPLYESFRGTQADYVKTLKVLNATLDNAKVQQTRWYQAAPASPLEALLDRLHLRDPIPPLDRLRNDLVVEVPRGKQVIYVTMTATTPGEAKLIVDQVLEQYVSFTKEREFSDDNERMGKLDEQRDNRSLEILGLENIAAQLRRKLRTVEPGDVVRQRALDLLKLEADVNALRTRIEIETRMLEEMLKAEQMGDASNSENAATSSPTREGNASSETAERSDVQPEPNANYILNPRWQQLNDRLVGVKREIRQREQRYGDQDEQLAELRKTRQEIESELQILETQLDQTGGIAAEDLNSPAALRKSIDQKRIELEGLIKRLEQEKEDATEYLADAQKLTEYDNDRRTKEDSRQKVERSLEEMRMNREVAGSVRTFEAIEPTEPENDKRMKLTIAALIGALGMGIGQAFLRIKISPTVNQVFEMASPARNALLGRLPLAPKTAPESLEHCPPQLESVRMIRTALLNRLNGAHGVVVQITSATLGSGKSTLAGSLARSLAQGGKKVLLVDTDLRRPTLAERFEINPSPGLRDVLADPESESASIRPTNTPGLSVLPAGAIANHAVRELLANGLFSGLLSRWRERYDVVLLDGAPLLGPADAAILAGGVDGTILVVREKHCHREAVIEALAVLSAAGGRLFGTVFVGSENTRRYGYGYGYGEEFDTDPSEAPRT